MPQLPQINSSARLPQLGYQQASPMEFGAGSGLLEMGEAMQRANDAIDMTKAKIALDNRSEDYKQAVFDMQTHPDDWNNLNPAEFKQKWSELHQGKDEQILQDLPRSVRRETQLLMANQSRQAFGQAFNEYKKLNMDWGEGQHIKRYSAIIKDIATAPDEDSRQMHTTELNAEIASTAHAGYISQKQAATEQTKSLSEVDQYKANLLISDSKNDGPSRFLSDYKTMFPNLNPDQIIALRDSAIKQAQHNETQAVKQQDNLLKQTDATLVNIAQTHPEWIKMEVVQDMLAHNEISSATATHVKSLLGNPTFANSPQAINEIDYERASAGLSLQANARARQRLLQLDPKDPEVARRLNILNASDKALRDRDKAGQVSEAVRQFKAAEYSNGVSVLRHFQMVPTPMRGKYAESMNQLELDVQRGIPRDQAVKSALERIRPKGVSPETNKLRQIQQDAGQ